MIEPETIRRHAEAYVKHIMMQIEEKRRLREQKDPSITKEYLAKRMGVSLALYEAYCSGEDPDVEMVPIFRALDLLECDAHDFFKECEAAYQ